MPRLFQFIVSVLLLSSATPVWAYDFWNNHLSKTIEKGSDKNGLYILGGGLAFVALSFQFDERVRDSFRNYQIMNQNQAKFGDFMGSGIPGISVALAQLYFDRSNGIAHSEALIETAALTVALKYSLNRQRPSPGTDNHHSMPSGHSSISFASATSLAYAYGWKAAVPAYTLATWVAASRWSDQAHWFSDTAAGALIGIVIGRATYHYETTWTPIVSTNEIGLVLNKKF